MTNLTPKSQFDDVYQLERNDPALAGPGGILNKPLQDLTNRTEYLKDNKADKSEIVKGQYSFTTLAKFNEKKSTIPANSTVIIEEAGANQGTNNWDGTTLTKSVYDPLAQAKEDATAKAEAAKNEAIAAALKEFQNVDLDLDRHNQAINALASSLAITLKEVDDTSSALEKHVENLNNRDIKLYTIYQALNCVLSDLNNDVEKANARGLVVTDVVNTRTHTTIHDLAQVIADVQAQVNILAIGASQDEKLKKLYSEHEVSLAIAQLEGFNPAKGVSGGGSAKATVTEGLTVFQTPSALVRIDVYTDAALPTIKGPVINVDLKISLEGSSAEFFGTLSVQGSSSAVLPKKNWTFAFFGDEARTEAVKVKIGYLLPQEELVFKSNFVDNTHCRNIGVNRLWDQMQLSRSGYPKREVDFVNMINSDLSVENRNGLQYAPTGAIGHVDGFPAVVYINNNFYGIGDLNIGKKRDNYNLEKNNQKHIQFEPDGGINLNNMPTDPTDGSFDLRRPSSWGASAQSSYDRLSSFFKMSVAEMQTVGIDNFLNRPQMLDYIILLQVCDLFDHLHKNTLFTTWDGLVWNMLPYDVDNCFGLYFTGLYFNPETAVQYRNSYNLPIPPLGAVDDSSWGVLARIRAVYGTAVDDRYKYLRNNGVVTLDNIMNILENLLRAFPKELLDAENALWNNGDLSLQNSLQQTGSLYQISQWLVERLARTDIYFNYSN